MATIHVCDYGIGNVYNVVRAIDRCGVTVQVVESAHQLRKPRAVVIPGVGAFGDCIAAINSKGFGEKLKELSENGVWILGICIGMQVLGTVSGEFGSHSGLNIIPGEVKLIPGVTASGDTLKRPHVGWANLSPCRTQWEGTPLGLSRIGVPVYFVHSYQFVTENPEHTLATVSYGGFPITAMIGKGRVFGMQFHPEKSGLPGLKMIEKFVSLTGLKDT